MYLTGARSQQVPSLSEEPSELLNPRPESISVGRVPLTPGLAPCPKSFVNLLSCSTGHSGRLFGLLLDTLQAPPALVVGPAVLPQFNILVEIRHSLDVSLELSQTAAAAIVRLAIFGV